MIVAIDGPAGAGKSTVSRSLAETLGLALVDTGALYRCVALAAREAGVEWADDARLGKLMEKIEISFRWAAAPAAGHSKEEGGSADRRAEAEGPEHSKEVSEVMGPGLTPAYAAALLRVAMELRRPDARPLDEILGAVLEGLTIEREAFKGFLSRNFSLIRAATGRPSP